MVIVNRVPQKDSAFEALAGMDIRYELYLKFEHEYQNVVNAYHTAFAEAQSDPDRSQDWPETYRSFVKQMNQALEHWKVFGYKREIEAAVNVHTCHPQVLSHLIPVRALAN
ncbi:MAG: hypothetical protein K0Q79_1252 [Flavipsychrobacter sp.]|jgi:hypothetical protein|nr:hypothetical protein [Flavipsychrobacter sp.]